MELTYGLILITIGTCMILIKKIKNDKLGWGFIGIGIYFVISALFSILN